MDPILISFGIGVTGAVLAAVSRLLVSRRSERVAAMGPARVIRQELGTVDLMLTTALEEGCWWGSDLAVPTWEAEKAKLACAMTDEEVETFHHTMRWLEAANAMADEGRRQTRIRNRGAGPGSQNNQLLLAIRGVVRLADQSITPVAKGKGGLLRRRRTYFSMSPDPRETCCCGHAWAEHYWGAKRRWIRFPYVRAPFVDVAMECRADDCSCKRFVSADGAWSAKRVLRRLRVLPQTRLPAPEDASNEPQERLDQAA